MSNRDFQETLEQIISKDPRYKAGAYIFVRMGLDYTVKALTQKNPRRQRRDVSTLELVEGLRDFALETFGPMARHLFLEWNVNTTADFGNIVFNLIDATILNKSKTDKLEDFYGVYDFVEAFENPFLAPTKQKINMVISNEKTKPRKGRKSKKD